MIERTKIETAPSGGGWRIAVWSAALLLWLTPLVAMQFSAEVQWTPIDFTVFGVMLTVAAGAFDLVTRVSGSLSCRAGAGLALLGAFLLVWVNLAVGIIGSEDNPANQMYAGVFAIGLIGAFVVNFRPQGLARVMVAVAVAQMAVAVVAFVIGYNTFVLNGGFAAVWLLSAWLFQRAAKASAKT